MIVTTRSRRQANVKIGQTVIDDEDEVMTEDNENIMI